MDTTLVSNAFKVDGVKSGSLKLVFESSWYPDPPMKARVYVQFDDRAPEEVLYWCSDEGSFCYHGDPDTSTTETVEITCVGSPCTANDR